MLNTMMEIYFKISSGRYIIHLIYATVLDITEYTFRGGGKGIWYTCKKASVSSCLSFCLSVSLSPRINSPSNGRSFLEFCIDDFN
jgi:hypothetical protein